MTATNVTLNSDQLDTTLKERLNRRWSFYRGLTLFSASFFLLFGLFSVLIAVLNSTDEIKDEGPSSKTGFVYSVGGVFLLLSIIYFVVASRQSKIETQGDKALEAALDLTDSMTNLYQAKASVKSLSDSMATILTPNILNKTEYDKFKTSVNNQYSDVATGVQRNIIKATYNAISPESNTLYE